jgi:hypothetical protein
VTISSRDLGSGRIGRWHQATQAQPADDAAGEHGRPDGVEVEGEAEDSGGDVMADLDLGVGRQLGRRARALRIVQKGQARTSMIGHQDQAAPAP